ncbi:MAG: methyltransferase domain-containing protein [Flavobacteriales bacterium]
MHDSPFDAVAATYDEEFTNSIIGRLQRARVWKFLKQDLRGEKKLRILEINCGTGIDAAWLVSQGHHVLATDVSEGMISKAKELHGSTAVCFEVCAIENIESKYGNDRFDVVFSNFGGLNCLSPEALKRLNDQVFALLEPNGRFIAVFLAKKPLMELLYFRLKGMKSQASRRQIGFAEVSISNGVSVPTWYYNAKEIKSFFKLFRVNKIRPVGLFVPPSYLARWVDKHSLLVRLLFGMELVFGGGSSFGDFGDHIYLSFSKA